MKKSTKLRILLPLSAIIAAGIGTAAFAATPESSYPPPAGCHATSAPLGSYVGYELGSGRVGACAGSGDLIYEPYAQVMTGTNKGAVVNDGLDGELYGAWVGSGRVCVQDSWSPNCV